MIISFFPAFLTAQSTFDKRFYLVDSLDEAGIVPQEKMLIDSCLDVFHQAKHDTEKVAAINFLVEELWNDNVWPKYNFWLYDFLSEKLKDTTDTKPQEKDFYLKYYSAVLNNTGYYFKTHDQLNKAIEFYNKSLKIDKLRNDKQSMALTYNNIAVIYLSLGKIEDALNYLSQALKSYESIDYKEGMSLVYNNIGAIYQKQNDYQNAKKFYLKSIQIDSALKRIKPLISTYSNLGLITLEEKDTLNAKKIFSKALSFADETSYLQGKALVLNNLGLCYLSDPPKDSALICFKKAKTLYEQTNNPSRVSYCQIHIAEFFLKKQQLALAQMYADSAYTIAKQIGFPELIEKSAGVLRKAAVLNENWQTAYKMLEEEFLMHDSLLNEKTKKSTELQLAQYQYEKQKAIEQKEHEKKLEIARKEKEKQQIITYFASSGLLAVLIFLWYLYTRFKIIRKQKEQISLQKEELEKVYTSLEEHHKEIQDSIVYSKRIQDIILPEKELLNTHLHSGFILFQPKDVVSGDFYWMEVFNNNVFFAAADCTGHGV
ncbi:MAG: tetratricopeptide repeat protein, partial [Bacteroidetes bacterium]